MRQFYFQNLRIIRIFTYLILVLGLVFGGLTAKTIIDKINSDSELNLSQQNKRMENIVSNSVENSSDPWRLTKFGITLLKNNETKLAIIALKKAVELDPLWRDSHWALAQAYLAWSNELTGKINSDQKQECEKRKTLTKDAVQATLNIDPVYSPARELLAKL